MQFLIKRETSLADALEALTTVMLHVLSAKYGKRDEFFRFFEQVSSFLESTERDRAIGLIPLPGTAKVQPRTVTMVERPEGILRLATEVGELITKCGPKSLHIDDAHRHRSRVWARKGGRVRLAYARVLNGDAPVRGRAGSVEHVNFC